MLILEPADSIRLEGDAPVTVTSVDVEARLDGSLAANVINGGPLSDFIRGDVGRPACDLFGTLQGGRIAAKNRRRPWRDACRGCRS